MSDHNPLPTTTPASRRRKALPILAIALTAGLVGAVATASFGQGGPGYGPGPGFGRMGPDGGPSGGPGGPGFGPGQGPGFWGGGPGFWRGGPDKVDPAFVEARADRMARHLAVEVGANAEQQEKLASIVKAALKDVLPVREKMFAAHKQARELLTAEKIDRAALEKLRADQLATHDAASKRIVQALADAAEVLTPEQRQKLDAMLPPGGHGFGPGFGRGHGMMGHGWGWR
jgi:hypothetical protein